MKNSQRLMSVSLLGLATLFSGCASTGTPDYRSTEAGERVSNTRVTEYGVRRYPDGRPVEVNYKACGALDKEIKAMTSGNATTRAINQGTGSVSTAIRRGGKGDLGQVLAGAAGGILVGIGGDQLNRVVNSPRIQKLEADCSQEKAFKEWQQGERAAAKEEKRQDAADAKAVTACVREEVKQGVPTREATVACREALGLRP